MGRAARLSRPPHTAWQAAHIEKTRPSRDYAQKRVINFECDMEVLHQHPDLLATYEHAQRFIAKFDEQQKAFAERTEEHSGQHENMARNLVRKVAPQWCLALKHLSIATDRPEVKSQPKGKLQWIAFARKELKEIKLYEPVWGMMHPYARKGQFEGGHQELAEACKLAFYGDAQYLWLALEKVFMPLDAVFKFPRLDIDTAPHDPSLTNKHNILKLESAKQKLETGIAEWEMILRYVATLRQGKDGVQQTLAMRTIKEGDISGHIAGLKTHLARVEEEIVFRELYMLNIDTNEE